MSPVFGHGQLRLYLLKLLAEEPRHGYDVIRLLEDRFLGLYAPSAGTVYPRLARLEAEGLVAHEELNGRKVYRLTEAGREDLAAHADDLARLEREIVGSVRDLAADVRREVHGSVRDLRDELRQAAREVRREDRHAARSKPPGGRGPASRELEQLIDRFRADARTAARRSTVDEERLAACRSALADALTRLREILGSAR